MSRLDRVRNVDLVGRSRQGGVLELVNRRQQNWKQRLEETSCGRVTKIVHDGDVREGTLEEDPERGG